MRAVGGWYFSNYQGNSLHYFYWWIPGQIDRGRVSEFWFDFDHHLTIILYWLNQFKAQGQGLVWYLIWIWPICLIISIKIFFWSKTITLWWDRDPTRAFQIYNCSAFKIVTKYKAGPGLWREKNSRNLLLDLLCWLKLEPGLVRRQRLFIED